MRNNFVKHNSSFFQWWIWAGHIEYIANNFNLMDTVIILIHSIIKKIMIQNLMLVDF